MSATPLQVRLKADTTIGLKLVNPAHATTLDFQRPRTI
jgi:hypothetical protein